MRAIFLECCKHYNFSPFSERSVAARGVGKFVPNHVNIVCRLIYLFILLSYIWKIGNCVIFPNNFGVGVGFFAKQLKMI